MKYNYKKY